MRFALHTAARRACAPALFAGALWLFPAPHAAAQDEPPQVILHTDGDAPETPVRRVVTETGIASGATLADLPATVRRALTVTSPVEDRIALLTEDADGALRVRFLAGGVWTADETIAADVSGADTRGFDACFEHRSGDLLIAYRRAGENTVFLRTHDGDLSVEMSVSLSLGAAPARVRLAPVVASDGALLAVGTASRLACARWTGDAVADALTIDANFDNDPLAWDIAVAPADNEPFILWARLTDQTARMRRFSDAAWQPEAPGPNAGSDIRRIALSADPGRAGETVLAGLGAIGAGETFRTSFWDGDIWSATEIMTTSLAGTNEFPMAVTFEGADHGALAIWRNESDNRLTFRRWDGDTWGSDADTQPVGADAVELLARPRAEAPDAVVLARRSVPVGSEPWRAYAVYSEDGALDIPENATIVGQTGANAPGVSLPNAPLVSAGSTNLSFGNNDDATIAPGSYKALSVGHNVTLRFSAGDYVFTTFSSNKNGTHLVFDTTAGDVELILTSGDFHANNALRIERVGDNDVFIHILEGDFISRNNETIDAVIAVHDGSLDIGLSANVRGHLLASGDISVGNSGEVMIPATQSLVALLIDDGAASAPTTLNATPWSGAWPMPMDVSSRTGVRTFRVIEWAEVPAYEN